MYHTRQAFPRDKLEAYAPHYRLDSSIRYARLGFDVWVKSGVVSANSISRAPTTVTVTVSKIQFLSNLAWQWSADDNTGNYLF